jgi:hypothetical protein
MLIALIEFEREELVAGLLLFRLLYYVIPFAFAVSILATREAYISLRGRRAAAAAAAAVPAESPVASVEKADVV